MNSRRVPARSLVVPGALLLAVSFALVGCAQGADAAKEGPITSRMNDLYGDDDGTDQWRAENDRYQEVIATCMKESGFEYTPVPMNDDSFAVETWSADDWDPVAEAKENGYYITPVSKAALIEQYGLDQTPDEPTDDDGSWFAEDDPNGAYYRSLSAADQDAYEAALWGPLASDEMETEYDWTTAGCHGEAFHEVYGDQMEAQEAQQDSTVMDDFSTYTEEKLDNDPRIIEANAAWASCMADQQYSFASPEEARTSIQQRFDQLTGSDSTGDRWVEPDPDLFSDDEIRALHDDEIATATADAQCHLDADLDKVFEDVYFDAETEFYKTHKSEVDAYFEAQEALLNKKK